MLHLFTTGIEKYNWYAILTLNWQSLSLTLIIHLWIALDFPYTQPYHLQNVTIFISFSPSTLYLVNLSIYFWSGPVCHCPRMVFPHCWSIINFFSSFSHCTCSLILNISCAYFTGVHRSYEHFEGRNHISSFISIHPSPRQCLTHCG